MLLYLVRVLGPGWKKGFPSFFPDSASYLKVAKLGPISPSFWFTERPVGVPLMMWLSAFNNRAFVLIQTTLFAVSVAFLCHTILRIMKVRPLAWLACAAITAIAIQPRFGIWNLEVLSESLGISLSIIALTCWLRAAQVFTAVRIWTATLATVAWMLVRDSHGIPALVLVLALAIFAWRASDQALRRTLVKCVGVLLLAFSYISVAQAVSNRNQYPLMNNIGLRILPDQVMTNHFVWTLNATCIIKTKTKNKIRVSVLDNKGAVNGKNLAIGQATYMVVQNHDSISVSAEPGTEVTLQNLSNDRSRPC